MIFIFYRILRYVIVKCINYTILYFGQVWWVMGELLKNNSLDKSVCCIVSKNELENHQAD